MRKATQFNWALAAMGALGGVSTAVGQQGPGIPALTYQTSELFRPLSTFLSPANTSWGNGYLIHGYLVLGVDVNEDSSGFLVYDISNPRQPRLAGQKYDNETRRLREIQDFTFTTINGRDYAAIPSHSGLEIWDFTNPLAPFRAGSLAIVAGGGEGVYNGIIYTFWQPPYIYCGGQNNGFYVVNAANIASMSVVRRVPNSALNGYLIGGAFALGNRLVVTTMQPGATGGGGFATYDISDPTNPQFIDFLDEPGAAFGQYTSFFNGGRIFGLGVGGYLQSYTVADNGQITTAGQAPAMSGRGGYGQYQDGFAHCGMSSEYLKYNVQGAQPQITGRYTIPGDNDWALVLGNLIFLGDDDGPTSTAVFLPHQAAPDRAGPAVNLILPRDGAVNQPLTTRVGISFSDNIEFTTLGAQNLIVSRAGGIVVPGRTSVQMGLVNFTPDASLLPGTTYQVRLPAGGIRDWAGNGIAQDFVSYFSTGPTVVSIHPLPGPGFRSAGQGLLSGPTGEPLRNLAGRKMKPRKTPAPWVFVR